jgi:hypothetical protein
MRLWTRVGRTEEGAQLSRGGRGYGRRWQEAGADIQVVLWDEQQLPTPQVLLLLFIH